MRYFNGDLVKKFIAVFLGVVIPLAGQYAYAECESSLRLQGAVSVQCCTDGDECIPATKAVYEYMQKIENPAVFSIGLQASPWHLYDADMRILTVEELAQMVKPKLQKPKQSVLLIASWTGVVPTVNGKSIAQKLSSLLDGFPVTGMDGFVWIANDGSVRTTQQAFTMKPKCPYGVRPGEEVMVSLVAGWPVEFEQDYVKNGDAAGIMSAGAGWDIYMLCPERALGSFEMAARLSHPIAAYNAALMRLERGRDGDFEAATYLMKQAAALGDKKAQLRLRELNQNRR
jgi:hypothetical protein